MYFALTAANQPQTISPWISIGVIVLMLAAFYFLMLRPQKKQEKEVNDMRNSLSVGDEIVTIGGIVGIIISINVAPAGGEDTITIVSSRDRTRIMLLRSAVSRVQVRADGTTEEDQNPAPAKKEKEKSKKD